MRPKRCGLDESSPYEGQKRIVESNFRNPGLPYGIERQDYACEIVACPITGNLDSA